MVATEYVEQTMNYTFSGEKIITKLQFDWGDNNWGKNDWGDNNDQQLTSTTFKSLPSLLLPDDKS